MHRIATGVLRFVSGNRVTVNDASWRRIQHNLFVKDVKTYHFF